MKPDPNDDISGAGGALRGTGEDDDDALLFDAVRDAGALALRYFGTALKTELKSDGSDVSEADIAVNDLLYDRLMGARPEYGWLSEETADNKERLNRERVWIVDPIDGTHAFLRERPEWAVSVALVEAGRPIVSAVYNPAAEAYYKAKSGQGATLSGNPIHVADRTTLKGSKFAVNAQILKRNIWPHPWPKVETFWINSVAYRMALVAAGDIDAMISMSGKNEWDIAAADLLVQEAGGQVTTRQGLRFVYNCASPYKDSVVVAGPKLHALLLAQTDGAAV